MMISNNTRMYAAFFIHGADTADTDDLGRTDFPLVKAAVLVDCGFWEFVNDMIGHSDYMHQVVCMVLKARDPAYSFPGVFEYEVCERFGEWYVRETFKRPSVEGRRYPPSKEACEEWIKDAVAEFFCQCESEEQKALIRATVAEC